jgi:hypothetical protein
MKVCGKADALIGALRSLLPNVSGLIGSTRNLYYGVWESVVLYAALVGIKAAERRKNRNTLKERKAPH